MLTAPTPPACSGYHCIFEWVRNYIGLANFVGDKVREIVVTLQTQVLINPEGSYDLAPIQPTDPTRVVIGPGANGYDSVVGVYYTDSLGVESLGMKIYYSENSTYYSAGRFVFSGTIEPYQR